MATRAKAPAASTSTPPEQKTMAIDIASPPEAGEALTLRKEALGLMVTDRASHGDALEFIRGCKQLKRKIDDHWSRITRSVDDLKRNLLTMKRTDLEPVESAIAMVEKRALDYDNEQRRREQEAADAARRKAQADAEEKRARELAEHEAQALKFEQDSPRLSAREEQFVELYLQRPIDAVRHASTVGYKDYRAAAERLLASPKIQDAIQAKRTAAAIRQQAEATRQAPLQTIQQRPVESQRAKAAGVRTTIYRSAEVVDLDALIDAVMAGRAPRAALMANQVYLNQEAKQLQDTFESVYPGCRLVVKQGIAG